LIKGSLLLHKQAPHTTTIVNKCSNLFNFVIATCLNKQKKCPVKTTVKLHNWHPKTLNHFVHYFSGKLIKKVLTDRAFSVILYSERNKKQTKRKRRKK